MISYLLKKLGYAILTLYGVVTVVFLLFYLLPGDPAQMMMGQNESEEQLAAVRAKYGFDQSLGQQYLYFLNDLSPLSVHSASQEDFTYDDGTYTGLRDFTIGETSLISPVCFIQCRNNSQHHTTQQGNDDSNSS